VGSIARTPGTPAPGSRSSANIVSGAEHQIATPNLSLLFSVCVSNPDEAKTSHFPLLLSVCVRDPGEAKTSHFPLFFSVCISNPGQAKTSHFPLLFSVRVSNPGNGPAARLEQIAGNAIFPGSLFRQI
jgi:hypothetical protein